MCLTRESLYLCASHNWETDDRPKPAALCFEVNRNLPICTNAHIHTHIHTDIHKHTHTHTHRLHLSTRCNRCSCIVFVLTHKSSTGKHFASTHFVCAPPSKIKENRSEIPHNHHCRCTASRRACFCCDELPCPCACFTSVYSSATAELVTRAPRVLAWQIEHTHTHTRVHASGSSSQWAHLLIHTDSSKSYISMVVLRMSNGYITLFI